MVRVNYLNKKMLDYFEIQMNVVLSYYIIFVKKALENDVINKTLKLQNDGF